MTGFYCDIFVRFILFRSILWNYLRFQFICVHINLSNPFIIEPDPWSPQPPVRTAASTNDPWSPATGLGASPSVDGFDLITNRAQQQQQQPASPVRASSDNGASSPFDLSEMEGALAMGGARPKKSAETFLGPNSGLVNLENLVKSTNVIIFRRSWFFIFFVCFGQLVGWLVSLLVS